jgi:eukaryotic-like serine/threonine-protein kinase
VQRALHIARQIVSALGSAHALGIVHRDLKPENVMLVHRGGDPYFAKVLDFGIAKVPIQEISERGSVRPGQAITKVGMVFGTPEYMAPEQALGQDVDGRCDLYGVGIILFEMLTQRRPYTASTAVALLSQQLQGPCPTVAERAPGIVVPPSVDALLARLLTSDREARYRTAIEVEDALSLLLSTGDSTTRQGSLSDAEGGWGAGGSGAGRASAVASTIPAPPDFEASHEGGTLGVLLGPLYRFIDKRRQAWPRPLRRVTTPVLALATLGVAGSVVVFGALAVLSSGHRGSRPEVRRSDAVPTSTAQPASVEDTPTRASQVVTTAHPVSSAAPEVPSVSQPGERATEVELSLARAAGVQGLRRLAAKVPSDASVVVELAKAQFGGGDSVGAVGSVAQALAVEPRLSRSAEVASLLWKTAQKRESSEATFTLLEGPMGERGADILFDLETTEGIRREVRARALSFFEQRRYVGRASPALAVLIDFRNATTCEERARLLERVDADADARIIPLLRECLKTTGCGSQKTEDCYPCLRTGRLESVLSVITQRSAG